MWPFTNTTLPILTSAFGLVFMWCPGSETGAEMKDQCGVEHYVFGLTSTELSLPCLVSHGSSVCLLKVHKNPWATIVSTEFSTPLAIFCRIWTLVCEVVRWFSGFFPHLFFFFSAVEPLNKQWPLTLVSRVKRSRLTPVLVWRNNSNSLVMNSSAQQFGFVFSAGMPC